MARIINVSTKKLPNSELEIRGEIPFDVLLPFRAQAMKEIAGKTELPGFRRGHVPESIILERVGEVGVLEEAVEHAFPELYLEYVREQGIEAVGRPKVALTKLAPGNPVGFTAVVAVMPDIALPDYQALANREARTEGLPVLDEDVEKLIEDVRQSLKTKDQGGNDVLPPVDDAFAARVGNFKSLAEMKGTTKRGLAERRANEAKEKRRVAITDAILEKTKLEVPDIFVESELEKMVGQLREDLKRLGSTLEGYLKNVKKTEDEMRREWRAGAEKRAKLQLVLNKIADEEKVVVAPEDIKREADHIIERFKDADRERVTIYVESVLRNEKIFQLLESL